MPDKSEAFPVHLPLTSSRWVFLALACVAVVMSLTTWFSATAVVPELTRHWQLSPQTVAWLTNGVQAGFVTGALLSSYFALSDRWPLPRMMALSAVAAAAANAILLADPPAALAVAARCATGFALAGVYPPAMKLMATWFRTGRGLALGLLIGALTLGSALPHLVRASGAGIDWRVVVIVSSFASLGAATIFALALREGPYPFARTKVDPGQLGAILRNRPLMLANAGYFGHMWELYAMWGWFLAYARAANETTAPPLVDNPSALTFWVLAAGVPGCVVAGALSDRLGRCLTTAGAMLISGSGAVAIGFAYTGPSWLFVGIALVWGLTIVADSAQFSASITELADSHLVGSALAFQMGVGFAITIVAIWLVPLIADTLGGWRWAFLILAPGPLLGAWAMLGLRRRPESVQMAGGHR